MTKQLAYTNYSYNLDAENFQILYEQYKDALKIIKNLKKENKQLKQENKLKGDLLKGDFREFIAKDIQKTKEENEQLKTQLVNINQLIDNKIDEFRNGDYDDLPCSTICMFLDLKQELGDLE